MLGELKRLGKEALVYGLSGVLGRLLNFLLLPFYTHCLRAGEYGIVATTFAYIAFLNVLYQYGMDQAYLRHAAAQDDQARAKRFSTAAWSLAATALAFSGSITLFSRPLAGLIGLPASLSDLPGICAWILALDALAALPFAELRLSHRPWTYVGIRTCNIGINVALNILLLWRLGLGARGVFLASLAASACGLLLCVLATRRFWSARPELRLLPPLLRFSLPFVPAGLASMAVQVIDRPILKALTNDATVGVYQANYRLGIFMMLVVGMFDAAWRPFFLERADRPGARALFGRVLTYFMLGAAFLVLALSLFIGDLARLPLRGRPIIHPDYWSGLGIVPIVLLGHLFYGGYINFMAQVTLAKRTDLLMTATALGAAVNVGGNLLLIPSLGMMGAAWAAMLAYAAMALALFALGQRLYPIPYEYGRLARITAAAAAVVAAACWLGGGSRTGPGGGAGARLAALAVYPLSLWILGFPAGEEKAALRRLINRLRRGLGFSG